MNIFQKLSDISLEIPVITKRLEVGEGKWKYKAVSETDILETVKPIEKAHGVYSYPMSRKVIESGTMESKQGTRSIYIRIETTYRFVNMDKPDEYVDIVAYGDGVDTMDKAPGKAMTYSDKYAIMKAYKISTGEDPDADESKPQSKVSKSNARITKADAQKLEEEIVRHGGKVEKILSYYGVDSLEGLTNSQAEEIHQWANKR